MLCPHGREQSEMLKKVKNAFAAFFSGKSGKLRSFFSALIILAFLSVYGYSFLQQREKYEQTEFLFDTPCTITVYGKEAKNAVSSAMRELKKIHSLADAKDRESDVARMNGAAANVPVKVDARTYTILKTAYRIYKDSGGAFDITVAPVSSLWNFVSENAKPPSGESISAALENVGFDKITLNGKEQTVTKSANGVKIDLGGAAKGFAADAAAEIIKGFNVSGAVIDLGGNVLCLGQNAASRQKNWRIGIQLPFSQLGDCKLVITLQNGAAVTSGTYQRCFEYNGKLYHHILDPKTGFPSNHSYNSVTIQTDSALTADCLATACFVLGANDGWALAQKYGAKIYFQ